MLEVGQTYTAINGKRVYIESYEKGRKEYHGYPEGEPKEWPISYKKDGTPTNESLGDWFIFLCPHCNSNKGTWFDRTIDFDRYGNQTGMVNRCKECGMSVDDADIPETHDEVSSPQHYTVGGYEALDVIRAKLTPEEYKGFLKGNILKYLMRANYKSQHDKDCKKAAFYAEKLKGAVGD